MDLVRQARAGEEVKITDDLKALLASPGGAVVGNVKTLRVEYKSAMAPLKVSGLVTYDPRAVHGVSARTAGRLEEVYVTSPLQHVRKGERVAMLYSPELAEASREFIFLQTRDAGNMALIQSARRRLELLGLTAGQIDELARRKETSGTYAIYSPYDGSVSASDTLLREGDYVSAGQTLFTLADTEALRVELELPGSYASYVHGRDTLELDLGAGLVTATVDLVQPFFAQGEDLLKVRINMKNTGALAIGKIITATLHLRGDESYWIPRGAVVDLGLRTVAFVRQQGVFKPRDVLTGTIAGDWVQVRSGLTSQDEVAAQAGYLVDSESFTAWAHHPEPAHQPQGEASPTATHESNTVMLNDTQAQLANLSTQKVTLGAMAPSIVANGRLVTNPQRAEVISSRAAGRIEKLYIKETGRQVRKGEPLYELYSETLLTLQQEYLLAREQTSLSPRYASLATAAEKKLLRYGLTQTQIENLALQKTAAARITFMAPASGLVVETRATEGQYIDEGSLLYRLEDITTLWAEGDLYGTEASQVKKGDVVSIQIDGSAEIVTGQVIFISSQYRGGSQVTVARVLLNNDKGRFTPGMQARMTFTSPGPQALMVPLSAVIRDARGAHVYVQTAARTYRPRRVTTGMEDHTRIEIVEGLTENEQIVATGAYLLYAEIILKKGTTPIATHHH